MIAVSQENIDPERSSFFPQGRARRVKEKFCKLMEKGQRFFLSSGFSPRSSRLRRSPLRRALDPLWFKREIRDCSQSKENETRKSSSMKEQYPGYQRFFLACADFSGSATTKVCVRRYLGAFQTSEGKRQASKERPTRATGEDAERWKSTNNGVWTGVSFSAPSHERQSFSRGSLKIETGTLREKSLQPSIKTERKKGFSSLKAFKTEREAFNRVDSIT